MNTSVMFSGNGDISSRLIMELSTQAEQKGFNGLWFGETTLRDASIMATAAAIATRRVQIGTSILNIYTRSPSQLALMAGTINELSMGRFSLGLGVSAPSIIENWHGQSFSKPMERMDETVLLLRRYFSQERVNYDGVYSSPRNAKLRVGPSPKIALAALNDQMIRMAARLGDRIILNLYPPEAIKHAIDLINDEVAGGSRPTLSVMLHSYVLGDDDSGLDAAKELLSFYASARAYSKLYSNIGFQKEARAMMDAWQTKDKESVKRIVTRPMIERMMVVGTIQKLRDRVKLYHECGVDDVFISPSPFGDYEANLHEILRHFF